MINFEMTVREAVDLIGLLDTNMGLRERLIKTLENMAGEGQSTLTLHSFPRDRKIYCIKTIRNGMEWGLKESKDWVEVVEGPLVPVYATPEYNEYSYEEPLWHETPEVIRHERQGGKPNTLKASTATVVQMAADLRAIGAVVTTS